MARATPGSGAERKAVSGRKKGEALRAGVVGLGYFGAFHAEKYATLPGCELVAVADRDSGRAEQVATEYEARAFTDHREMLGLVDVVSIVTPVGAHYAVARDFIEAGVHVLVEKAITATTEEAEHLIQLSRDKGVVLQVGHLERFNPVFRALPDSLRAPTYIEAHRLTQFRQRAVNVSVVLDLMIHDIDLVHTLVQSPLVEVQAKGVSVYSDSLDLVNAVLHFDNGAVANLTASRVSMDPQRSIHLFQHHAYSCLDMHQKSMITQIQKADGGLESDRLQLDNEDTLRTEVADFLHTIKTGGEPTVTGSHGLRALDTAIRIAQAVESSLGQGEPLPVHQAREGDNGYVTHDRHPETREPFFSRTSLVGQDPDSTTR